ncbi:hypothetical protein EV424DRAFT_1354985 [Suillus variegatus]|nr:hypothetical protein EV424DRAFT_1354985 [Suillus variegatus]
MRMQLMGHLRSFLSRLAPRTIIDYMILLCLHPTSSPQLTISHVQQPTTVSGDVLLPLLIFTIVKSDLARLVSRTQCYHNAAFAGEEEWYCLINLMGCHASFWRMWILVLWVSRKALHKGPHPNRDDIPVDVPGSLRGRVEQGFDAIAGSTIKVISGVVDSSFNATYSAPTGDQSRVVKHGAVEIREWVLDCGFGAGDEGEGGGWGGAEEEHVHNARILRSFESMMGGNSGKARKNKLASMSLTGSTGTDGITLHLTFLTAPPLAPQLSTKGRLPHLHFEFDDAIKCWNSELSRCGNLSPAHHITKIA